MHKKVLSNIVSSLILQIVTIICGFITSRLIIINYGSDVNGLLTSITKFLTYITLLEVGFGGIVKSLLYKPIAKNNKQLIVKILRSSEKFFRILSKIFIIYIIILCIFLPLILEKDFSIFFTISLIIIISISSFAEYYFGMTYNLYLQASQKNYIISIIQIITLLINFIVIIVLIHLQCDIRIIKLATAFIFLLRPLLLKYYVKKKCNIDLKSENEFYKINQKLDAAILHLSYVVYNNSDIIILTFFSNITEVSVYALYALIANSIKNIVISFSSGMDAFLGDLIAKHNHNKLLLEFNLYEGAYLNIITIIFSTTIVLILPFMQIYTFGIEDANYIRPIFAALIVFDRFIFSMRQPYLNLIFASGKFKETTLSSVVELIINILLSILLVFKFGITGVIIGTLVSIFFRTTWLIVYTSNNILKRNIWCSLKKELVSIFEITLILFIYKFTNISVNSYFDLIILGIIVFIISIIIVIFISCLIDYKNIKGIYNYCKKILKKKISTQS